VDNDFGTRLPDAGRSKMDPMASKARARGPAGLAFEAGAPYICACVGSQTNGAGDMAKKTGRSSAAEEPAAVTKEREALLKSLRKHNQVVESDDENAPLGPGQTHVYVKTPGQGTGKLIEKRKSFFKR
jgi:hypothetical protein